MDKFFFDTSTLSNMTNGEIDESITTTLIKNKFINISIITIYELLNCNDVKQII